MDYKRTAMTILLLVLVQLAIAAPPTLNKEQRKQAMREANQAKYDAAHHIVRPPRLPDKRPLEVGDRGTLSSGVANVIQVIDKSNLIARIYYDTGRLEPGHSYPLRPVMKEQIVWMSEVSTAGVVDGGGFLSSQVFSVRGTKTYATATGSKTVMLLKPEADQNPIPKEQAPVAP